MIKGCHTDNGIFNTSKFMEELLKKQKNLRFSGASASHQNEAAELTNKKVIIEASAILILDWMICHKNTLFIDFGQQKWTMFYEYKVGSLIYSIV